MDSTTDKLTSQLKASERALQLCYLIEALPASIQQTEISILASEVRASLDTLAAECLRLREAWQAICKAVTMGSDSRLEISMGVPSEQLSGTDRDAPGKPNLKNPRTPIPSKVYANGWPANYLCCCSQCWGQFYGAKLDVVCPKCETPRQPLDAAKEKAQ